MILHVRPGRITMPVGKPGGANRAETTWRNEEETHHMKRSK